MKRVGRHTIVRELASFGVLSTFHAVHDDGRDVRLRVFDADLEAGEAAVKRFERAVSCVAAVRHQGIDRPIEWSSRDPVHISTALSRGASLRAVCDASSVGRVAVDVAAGVGVDVAEALHAAHSAGAVHASLSLDSILLGTDGRARVTDFGLIRILSEGTAAHRQIMRSTVESLAPEHLSDPDAVGPHTDVFCLGLALYRAMTGKPAFDAPSTLGMSIRLSMGKPTGIDSHGVAIPDELKELVMKMLSPAPEDRPPLDLVGRTLATHAGPWRDAVRALAASAAPPVERENEEEDESAPAERSAPPEPESGEKLALSHVQASPPAPPTGADSPFPPTDALDRPSAVPPTPSETPFPAYTDAEAPPFDTVLSGSYELATQPELALPEHSDREPTLFEIHAPDAREEFDEPVEADTAHGGDTSLWPSADEPPHGVPKTVILQMPGERAAPTSAPRIRALAAPPVLPEPDVEFPAPQTGTPEWALWTAIALGAFALVVGTATLVILIAG